MSHKSLRLLFYANLLQQCGNSSSYNAAVPVNLQKLVLLLIAGFPYLENLEGPTNRLNVGALYSVRDKQCHGSGACWDTPAACFLSVLAVYSHLGGSKVKGITF